MVSVRNSGEITSQPDRGLPEHILSGEVRMTRIGMTRFLTALALAGVCGCSDSMGPPPDFSGTWAGSTAAGGTAFNVSMTTTESNGQISGSGLFTVGSAGGVAFTVTGSHSHPQVSITIRSTGTQDANYSGRFTGDRVVDGTLNGSGFANVPLTLQKQ
jgi:hypothetical protein